MVGMNKSLFFRCIPVTHCRNIYHLELNEHADVDLKANITGDKKKELVVSQGAGEQHAWTNKDGEKMGPLLSSVILLALHKQKEGVAGD